MNVEEILEFLNEGVEFDTWGIKFYPINPEIDRWGRIEIKGEYRIYFKGKEKQN